MMIDHPTERGNIEPRLLYESPFTDIDPLGVCLARERSYS
jgi:type I restriction enzyme, R subunit